MNPKRKTDLLNNYHWVSADYHQRMTRKDWREVLLTNQDRIIFKGKIVWLKAKSIGSGIVEVYKDFPKENKNAITSR